MREALEGNINGSDDSHCVEFEGCFSQFQYDFTRKCAKSWGNTTVYNHHNIQCMYESFCLGKQKALAKHDAVDVESDLKLALTYIHGCAITNDDEMLSEEADKLEVIIHNLGMIGKLPHMEEVSKLIESLNARKKLLTDTAFNDDDLKELGAYCYDVMNSIERMQPPTESNDDE